jgi:hypothetical protein
MPDTGREDNLTARDNLRRLSLVVSNSHKLQAHQKVILGETELAMLELAVETLNDLWHMILKKQE